MRTQVCQSLEPIPTKLGEPLNNNQLSYMDQLSMQMGEAIGYVLQPNVQQVPCLFERMHQRHPEYKLAWSAPFIGTICDSSTYQMAKGLGFYPIHLLGVETQVTNFSRVAGRVSVFPYSGATLNCHTFRALFSRQKELELFPTYKKEYGKFLILPGRGMLAPISQVWPAGISRLSLDADCKPTITAETNIDQALLLRTMVRFGTLHRREVDMTARLDIGVLPKPAPRSVPELQIPIPEDASRHQRKMFANLNRKQVLEEDTLRVRRNKWIEQKHAKEQRQYTNQIKRLAEEVFRAANVPFPAALPIYFTHTGKNYLSLRLTDAQDLVEGQPYAVTGPRVQHRMAAPLDALGGFFPAGGRARDRTEPFWFVLELRSEEAFGQSPFSPADWMDYISRSSGPSPFSSSPESKALVKEALHSAPRRQQSQQSASSFLDLERQKQSATSPPPDSPPKVVLEMLRRPLESDALRYSSYSASPSRADQFRRNGSVFRQV